MARGLETRIYALTNEDVEEASRLYCTGKSFRDVAVLMRWTGDLLWRVVRLCRECNDAPSFPIRYAPRASVINDEAALDAVKKPKPKSTLIRKQPTYAEWKRALRESGLKPSTVPTRRPADYLTKRKPADPTLALPVSP